MTLAIETRDLGRIYKIRGHKRKDAPRTLTALANVNLEVRRGQLFGLLGPNGAGKTTLIKILSTLLLPSSGTALVDGLEVTRDVTEIRRRIAMVSGGETSGCGLLTVEETLWMFARFYGLETPTARARIDQMLAVVGLTDRRRTKISDLSTGLRQKMNFVRGFINPLSAPQRHRQQDAADGAGVDGVHVRARIGEHLPRVAAPSEAQRHLGYGDELLIDKDVLIRSHAGMRLIALSTLYNRADFERLLAYIEEHFTADALAVEATAARLQTLREQFDSSGKVRVQQVIAHDPHQVVVMLSSERGLLILEDLQVEADYPHKIKAHTRQIVL